MDITELRKNPTANQRRIAELKKKQRELLREQKSLALDWNSELQNRNKVQTTNIRKQMVAVFLSQQPGAVDPGTTPPDVMQAADYKRRMGNIEQVQKSIEGLSFEIHRLEQEERKINEQKAQQSHCGSFNEWVRSYGEPSRKPDKFEKWLSYVNPSRNRIRGAESKDGTVKFAATESSARFVRKGMLTD